MPNFEQRLECQTHERLIYSQRPSLDKADDSPQYLKERDPSRDLDALGRRQQNQRIDRPHTIARVLAP
jgi:hypothetical protein